jgi:hypothetical protein
MLRHFLGSSLRMEKAAHRRSLERFRQKAEIRRRALTITAKLHPYPHAQKAVSAFVLRISTSIQGQNLLFSTPCLLISGS